MHYLSRSIIAALLSWPIIHAQSALVEPLLAKSLYSENREEKETPKETAIYERKATRPKVASAKPDFTDKFSW